MENIHRMVEGKPARLLFTRKAMDKRNAKEEMIKRMETYLLSIAYKVAGSEKYTLQRKGWKEIWILTGW